jgi:uncharacterized protein (DUF1330 family)
MGRNSMTAFFIVKVQIPKESARAAYDEYIAKGKPVVESHRGQYIVRSEKIESFGGDWRPDRLIVVQFESKPQLMACFSSEEYRGMTELRERSVHAEAIIVEE